MCTLTYDPHANCPRKNTPAPFELAGPKNKNHSMTAGSFLREAFLGRTLPGVQMLARGTQKRRLVVPQASRTNKPFGKSLSPCPRSSGWVGCGCRSTTIDLSCRRGESKVSTSQTPGVSNDRSSKWSCMTASFHLLPRPRALEAVPAPRQHDCKACHDSLRDDLTRTHPSTSQRSTRRRST